MKTGQKLQVEAERLLSAVETARIPISRQAPGSPNTHEEVMAQLDQLEDTCNLKGVFDVALEIARDRQETLRRLRSALKTGDDGGALKLARKLCGLENEETRN